MKVFVVYCHPSEDSFTRHVRDAFLKGIADSGNEYVVSDLYRMGFLSDMTEQEYLRDANYRDADTLAPDVLAEHEKIQAADAIVFIYPVFWTEAPAKLVGWFDRVWSYGFAYGAQRMKRFKRALFLCTAGHTIEELENFKLLYSMQRVMMGDRLFGRAESMSFKVFGGMARDERGLRELNWDAYLREAYAVGSSIFSSAPTDLYDNRFFKLVSSSASGEVDASTVFAYRQKGAVVWAEYAGGTIVQGMLLGTMDAQQGLSFSYTHVNRSGEQKSGRCTSRPEFLAGGRLRLHETWRWDDGTAGESILEEL